MITVPKIQQLLALQNYMKQNSAAEIPSLSRCTSAGQLFAKEQSSQVRSIREYEGGELVQKFYVGKYKYSSKDILGKGISSTVYKASPITKPKEKCAVKVIDLANYGNVELLEMEIETLLKIRHPNIIQCLDIIKTPKTYYLVMEYCPHGDLEQLIRFQKFIPQDRAILIMQQILEGYKALLAKNIIHRDLKPANIMRFGNKWKIGDFGFARFCKEEFLLQKIHVGTPLYLPLECLDLNKYSFKSDAFSLGIIYYEMLFGNTPWPVKTEQQLIAQLKSCSAPQIPEGICEQSSQFLTRTLQVDFYKRITKDEFKKFSFAAVDIQSLIKTRPPKGMSPAVKRSLSKSVSKRVFGSAGRSRPELDKSSSKNSNCQYGLGSTGKKISASPSSSSLHSNTNNSSHSHKNINITAADEYFVSSPIANKKPLVKQHSSRR